MLSNRQLFLQHVGQTSDFPLQLEIERAEGIYMYDTTGKAYIDMISGVSVSNIGHRHPAVVQAVKNQVDSYMHLMVYGEYVQSPQVKFAHLLAKQLPEKLDSTYFVNSGSEAIEGAMKLAKRHTGRHEIVAFRNAYHGSTHGALSLMSDSTFTQAFRPLVPSIRFLDFNDSSQLEQITDKTAAVVIELVQGEGGVIPADNQYVTKLRERCTSTGTLLIIDEIQTGFGRTGSLFAFMHYGIVPDIFCIAKAMGGGMPIGAFVASKTVMDAFKTNPVLGHITTFGGHPVSAAAALASLKFLLESRLIDEANSKGELFKQLLRHKLIRSIRGRGLFYSVELQDFTQVQQFISIGIKKGFVTDWFLFCDKRFRIAPPLTISTDEIKKLTTLILETLDLMI